MKNWVLVKFRFFSWTQLTPASNKQVIIFYYTKLHTFRHEQSLFLSMTLFKLIASSSEEKVADFSEQCRRRVSSVVGA